MDNKRPRRPSISTGKGDEGITRLSGGQNLSKSDARVEAYGAIDELNTVLGFARACCDDPQICLETRGIQRELFLIGAALSTKPGGKQPVPVVEKHLVEHLDELVAKCEAESILRDWALPGACRESAAFEMARAVCRRAERATVRYVTNGGTVQPTVLAYINRLSDLLWLYARVIEARQDIDARLRDDTHPGPAWSAAW